MKIKYADATKYPKIFNYFYWVNFRIDYENLDLIMRIIENRNNFVIKEKIIRNSEKSVLLKDYCFYITSLKKRRGYGEYDHMEAYFSKNGDEPEHIVLINNPYYNYDNILLNNGWERYNDELYSGAYPYIKRISKHELKKELKTIKQEWLSTR